MRDVLIERFGLQPHPEGGYFRETFRGADRVVRELTSEASPGETRSASTAITTCFAMAHIRRGIGFARTRCGTSMQESQSTFMSSIRRGSCTRIAWVTR